MDRNQIVGSVASDLHATEKAVDAAITASTTLVQSMIGARTLLNVSPVAGSLAQAKAIEAIAALSSAREAIVACHSELQKAHRRQGFGIYAVGPMDKPDDWETPIGSEVPPPRVTRVA